MGRAIPLKQVFAKPLITSYPKSDHISTRCRIHAGQEEGHQRWTRSCHPGIISKLCCLLKPPSYARREQLLETITLTVLNFKVVFREFWGTTKAVLELYRLQGLPKLKVSACWRNVMLCRHISDKPAVCFNSVAPVISMEMSWGVVASLSPPKHPIPAILVTVSMLIWAHLACDIFFLYLISSLCCFLLHFFATCPHQCPCSCAFFFSYHHQLLERY